MQKFVNFNIDTTIDNSIEIEKRINKGDTLKFTIKVFNNGVLANLTNDTVSLVLNKADGTVLEDVTTTKANGIVTFDLSQQATLATDKVIGTLQITESSTSHLSTNVFTYFVNPSITDSVLEASKNEIKSLGDVMAIIKNNTVIINDYVEDITQIAGTVESVQALANIATYINTNLPLLISENNEAVTNIANENAQNDEAVINIANLTTKNGEADVLNTNLESNILSGNILNLDLEGNITAGDVLNLDLEGNISTGGTLKTDLESATTTGATLKGEIITENVRAEANIIAMEGFGDVTALTQTVTDVKNEVETARNGESSLDVRLDKNDVAVANITADLLETMQQVADYNVYASTKVGDYYTIVDYKRADATLYCKSALSNVDSNGYYQICTLKFYNALGTTAIKTLTWTLTYDANGTIITKVVA